jgi:Protein of unknown function DUF262/HNH endonuclease
MTQRVSLDAMIQREDFARELKGAQAPSIIRELKLSDLLPNAAIRRQLRKPEFQRETNHWTPAQVIKLLASFLDGDVIPSIILWRSSNFVFVIDGAHRLSAICAWLEDDFGDRTTSKNFYSDEISDEQKKIAKRVRREIEATIGSYSSLDRLVGTAGSDKGSIRAGAMNTRPIYVQTVEGNAKVAEDSFFAINSQGTPLDETEQYLIRNREKPISIGARAIARAGQGHQYWSSFDDLRRKRIVELASNLHHILFEPETNYKLKTLDLPLAGTKSPVDALAVLIDFLAVISPQGNLEKLADDVAFKKDETGESTIRALEQGLKIANRITGNSPGSLGLHPAVYFSNDKRKNSRFLFLGMCTLIAKKLRNNDDEWFKKFTRGRSGLENFLIENKSLLGIVLQNLGKKTRIPKMMEMFEFVAQRCAQGDTPVVDEVFSHLGLSGRILDLKAKSNSKDISDNTKSQAFYRDAILKELKCPICSGFMNVAKSVSYDHVLPVREGGLGNLDNVQLVHPFCNTAMKN